MSRTRYRVFEDYYPYFMTCTVVGWLPLFTRPAIANFVLDAWRFAQRERKFELLGYVILENHLHLIAKAPGLSEVMRRFKSYTARQTIDYLTERGEKSILAQLAAERLSHKVDSDYQVWQEGNHPKQIQTDSVMWQKLEYIHFNPLRRGYVDDPLHWRYSSARNYAKQPGLIDVITDWM